MENNLNNCNNKKDRPPTFTKKDIAKQIAESREVHLDVASIWVDTVLTAVRDVLLTANPELRIEIRDFGVFEVKLTKSKPKARNPQTGEVIFVPPHKKTHFRPGKLLKNFLSQPLN
ncbi:MAG: HU family DNA-binding protein [Bacteroidota bacterium]